MMNPIENLKKLNLELPTISRPGGSYVSVNLRGALGFVAIQFPILNNHYLYQGRLGKELTTEQGVEAMELCGLHVLAQISEKVGFEGVLGLNHLDAYYQASGDWDDAPLVVDAASDLFIRVLGEKGRHTRAIFGVEKLPRNFSVGLTVSFTLKNEVETKV